MSAEAKKQPAQSQSAQPGSEGEMRPAPEFLPRFPGAGKLKDKVALITGGDSGIGRSVAVHMAREGADIAVVYLDEDDDAAETRKHVEAEGRRCILLSGDVADEAFCKKSVEACVGALGRLDILVNNAAEQHLTGEGGPLDISQEQLELRTPGKDRCHEPRRIALREFTVALQNFCNNSFAPTFIVGERRWRSVWAKRCQKASPFQQQQHLSAWLRLAILFPLTPPNRLCRPSRCPSSWQGIRRKKLK